MATATYTQVLDLVEQLAPEEQEQMLAVLGTRLAQRRSTPGPSVSLQGLLARHGPGPSAEEIDEARAELWASFAPEDIR